MRNVGGPKKNLPRFAPKLDPPTSKLWRGPCYIMFNYICSSWRLFYLSLNWRGRLCYVIYRRCWANSRFSSTNLWIMYALIFILFVVICNHSPNISPKGHTGLHLRVYAAIRRMTWRKIASELMALNHKLAFACICQYES